MKKRLFFTLLVALLVLTPTTVLAADAKPNITAYDCASAEAATQEHVTFFEGFPQFVPILANYQAGTIGCFFEFKVTILNGGGSIIDTPPYVVSDKGFPDLNCEFTATQISCWAYVLPFQTFKYIAVNMIGQSDFTGQVWNAIPPLVFNFEGKVIQRNGVSYLPLVVSRNSTE